MIIYKITNKINGKSYIGQTIRPIKERWSEHCKKNSDCSAIANAIQKYGKENFTIESVFETGSIDELNKMEQELIIKFDTLKPNGYNLSTGGLNFIRCEDTRKKMSAHQIGEGNHRFGKKVSVETKKKMSAAKLGENNGFFGKTHSIETRDKLSKINKSRPVNPRIGTKHSASSLKKMSESHKGVIAANRIPIICNETGTIYESMTHAADHLKLDLSSLSKHLKGKRRRINGLTFVLCKLGIN